MEQKIIMKNNKEKLRENATDKYRNSSEEQKNKKREDGKKRYQNISEEKKQKLKEYQKKLSRGSKSINIMVNKIAF